MSYRSEADLGGQAIHDRVVPEAEGELFHAPWERQALALTLAMGATGLWNIDVSRSARETLPDYRSLSYYQIWIKGLEKLLIERQLVGADELAAARQLHAALQVPHVLRAAEVGTALRKGSPTQRRESVPARFAVGDRVRTRAGEIGHHTRLPRYARGKTGRIEQVRGVHVFADSNAQQQGEQPQWLYTVVFPGRELWGDATAGGLSVSIDAWEPYLEPVP
jgi:nitrile hydratase